MGRHDIHSPFVYEYVDKCLHQKIDSGFQQQTNKIRKKFIKDQRIIEIVDAGAGSRKLGNRRTVSQIFRTSSVKGVYADILCQIVAFYQPLSCLELGTSLGIGTRMLTYGDSNRKVVTIDACKNTQDVAKGYFEEEMISNQITTHCMTFDEYFQQQREERFDLVYIDGHHNGEALHHYMEALEKITHPDTIFILDDIRWSSDMKKAWNELVGKEKYHLTMDLFRMGIIIPRPQQEKQHFVIRLKNVLNGF